jgi:hypothetical protein
VGPGDVEGVLRGVSRYVRAHEVAVALALVIGAMTENRVGDVAKMQV